MRIAQIPPLIESVPPKGYGGTERIVSYLTEGLVKRGHEVTLFASGDSQTEALLVPVTARSLRAAHSSKSYLGFHFTQMEKVSAYAHEFDILHFHNDFLHFPISRRSSYTHLSTLHGRLDVQGLNLLFREYREMPLVSISDFQRQPVKQANWIATVYHGLPRDLYKPKYDPGSYLAFLGRISAEKRPDRAIEIAKRAGLRLRIAAKIDDDDKKYYESIKHLFDHPLVEFIGEIGEEEKSEFLGNALALIFPIDWPEPFGLVMAEALACGTPVIAFRNGSVPEVIDECVTGYIVSSVEEAAKAVNKIHLVSRKACRSMFEERFEAGIMVKNYEEAYWRTIDQKKRFRIACMAERMKNMIP